MVRAREGNARATGKGARGMSEEETNITRGIVPMDTMREAINDMYKSAREFPDAVLHVEAEIEGKRYKGTLYPVEEQQAQEPPVIRIDEKLISKGY
jgi:hypothetical protein